VDIYLIRHCESVGNREKKMQGWFDSPLTGKGKRQAKEVALRMKGRDVQRLFSSPLARAVDTARVISREIGCSLEELELLREIDVGKAEGITIDEAEELYPDHVRDLLKKTVKDASLPGGETLARFHDRAGRLWVYLCSQKQFHTIACVSHGWMINALLKKAQSKPLTTRNLVFPNGAIQHLRSDEKRWEVVSLEFVEEETSGMRMWQLF